MRIDLESLAALIPIAVVAPELQKLLGLARSLASDIEVPWRPAVDVEALRHATTQAGHPCPWMYQGVLVTLQGEVHVYTVARQDWGWLPFFLAAVSRGSG